MLWGAALILFTLFLYLMVASLRNLVASIEGVYEETKDRVSKDAYTKLGKGHQKNKYREIEERRTNNENDIPFVGATGWFGYSCSGYDQ